MSPGISPVAALIGSCPEQNSRLPDTIAWLYGPMAPGAPAADICFFMIYLLYLSYLSDKDNPISRLHKIFFSIGHYGT
jgi:hypothetical protein